MRKSILTALMFLMVLGTVGTSAWKMVQKDPPEPARPSAPVRLEHVRPAIQPQPEPPTVPPVVAPERAEPAGEPSQKAGEAPLLTAKTLAGTRWKEGQIDVAFLPDGRWQMNGRVCAKWEVEGRRVRIFDDKGETHYVEIVGDTLAFNGKNIGRVKE